MSDKPMCCERVMPSGSFHEYDCNNRGKVEVDGKWYCGTHDPVKAKARRDASNAKWEAERKEAQRRLDIKTAERDVINAAISWDTDSDEEAALATLKVCLNRLYSLNDLEAGQ